MRAAGRDCEIAFEMMNGIERIIYLVVVKQAELVMNFRIPRPILQSRFIKADRACKIAGDRFGICVFELLHMAR